MGNGSKTFQTPPKLIPKGGPALFARVSFPHSNMSRGGGRGGGRGRGGRGGGWGRGAPGSELLALGLTPADLAAISKEQAALYPVRAFFITERHWLTPCTQ